MDWTAFWFGAWLVTLLTYFLIGPLIEKPVARWLRLRRLEEPPPVTTFGSERHNKHHVMLGCPFCISISGPMKRPSEWRSASPNTERTP